MKKQKVLQLIEIVDGSMLPISYWTSVTDLADYLNVSGQAVRNAAAGLCKCKGSQTMISSPGFKIERRTRSKPSEAPTVGKTSVSGL